MYRKTVMCVKKCNEYSLTQTKIQTECGNTFQNTLKLSMCLREGGASFRTFEKVKKKLNIKKRDFFSSKFQYL